MNHPSTPTLQVAVIGCGYWGKNLVRNFARLGVLALVCDTAAGQTQAAALAPDIPLVADLAEALAAPMLPSSAGPRLDAMPLSAPALSCAAMCPTMP